MFKIWDLREAYWWQRKGVRPEIVGAIDAVVIVVVVAGSIFGGAHILGFL